MARLVVYGSSAPCADMARFRRWLEHHDVDLVEFDVARDELARRRLLHLVGHASVPTLVAAADGSVEPVAPASALRPGQRVRGADRGSVLAEPHPEQIAPFLERHGIRCSARS